MRNFHPGKRRSQGLGLNSLTDDELFDIHLATLEVLEKAGLYIQTDEALNVFDGAGAEVDRKTKIVKLPPYLVEDAIRSAPSKILLAGATRNTTKCSRPVGFTSPTSAKASRWSIRIPASAGRLSKPILPMPQSWLIFWTKSMSVKKRSDPVMCLRG